MKRQTFTLYSGEKITLHLLDSGNFACPVCGRELFEPPYADGHGLDEQGRIATPDFAMGSHEICSGCKTQFGDDDFPEEGKTTAQTWEELRRDWLRQVPSRQAAAAQLKNIGVELED